MKVRALIVNYRTADLTSDAVASVLQDDPSTQVSVVDNGSRDGSLEELRARWPSEGVTIIDADANLGFGRGVNLASIGCDAEALLVLNSDARIRRGAIAVLSEALGADPHLAVAAPLIVTADGTPQIDAYGAFPTLGSMLSRSNRHPRDLDEPDWISGVAFLIRRDAFDAVGGFDARYWMYFEDVDLCRRLRATGWGIRRVRDAVVEHIGGASKIATRAQAGQYAASQSLYLRSAGYPPLLVHAVATVRRPLDWARARASR